jgi:hypothetical protein
MLPLLQLAAYIPLVWYGCWYRPTWQHWMSPSSDTAGFYPNWIDGIEPFPEQLAAGINSPAMVLAAWSVMPFDHWLASGASIEFAIHVVTALYIPLLWYLIGKRLDERGKRKSPPLSRGRNAVAVVTLVGLLSIAILLVWSFLEGQRYTMVSLSFAWIGCGILAVWFQLRRTRRHVSGVLS